MKGKPPLDVHDTKQALDDIGRLRAQLHNSLIFLGLEYINKITGTLGSDANDRLMLLRDSILYRVRILAYHLHLLQSIQSNQITHLQSLAPGSAERQMFLLDAVEQQFGILDDLIFHSISLFDYIGNLADYVCGAKGQMKLKWNGLVRSCRDSKNEMSRSTVSATVLGLNKTFVGKLYEHRSQLIHYRYDLGAAQSSFNLMSGLSKFTVFAPKNFVQAIDSLRTASAENELTLNYVSFSVVEKCIKGATEVSAKMALHINEHRITAPGREVFISKQSLK